MSSFLQNFQFNISDVTGEQNVATNESFNTGPFNPEADFQILLNNEAFFGSTEPPPNVNKTNQEGINLINQTFVNNQYVIPTYLEGPIGLIKKRLFIY